VPRRLNYFRNQAVVRCLRTHNPAQSPVPHHDFNGCGIVVFQVSVLLENGLNSSFRRAHARLEVSHDRVDRIVRLYLLPLLSGRGDMWRSLGNTELVVKASGHAVPVSHERGRLHPLDGVGAGHDIHNLAHGLLPPDRLTQSRSQSRFGCTGCTSLGARLSGIINAEERGDGYG